MYNQVGILAGCLGGIFLSEWAARIGRKSLFAPGAYLSAISGVHDGFTLQRME
jgi:hypothetical protein